MYEIYYKPTGDENWHKIVSTEPITYTQQRKQPPYKGGKTPGVRYRIYVKFSAMLYPPYCGNNGNGISPASEGYIGDNEGYLGPIQDLLALPFEEYCGGKPNYSIRIKPADSTGYLWIYHYPGLGGFLSPPVLELRRVDGAEDDDGNSLGPCVTKFFSGGQQIGITESAQCAEVETNSPNECKCCSDLLPIADSILAGLN